MLEGSPGTKVNLAKELSSGKGLIIGVPAAFSEYITLNLALQIPKGKWKSSQVQANLFPRSCMFRDTHSWLYQLVQAQERWQGLRCSRQ